MCRHLRAFLETDLEAVRDLKAATPTKVESLTDMRP